MRRERSSSSSEQWCGGFVSGAAAAASFFSSLSLPTARPKRLSRSIESELRVVPLTSLLPPPDHAHAPRGPGHVRGDLAMQTVGPGKA